MTHQPNTNQSEAPTKTPAVKSVRPGRGGNRQRLLTPLVIGLIREESARGKLNLKEICARYKISIATAYRVLSKKNAYRDLSGEPINIFKRQIEDKKAVGVLLYHHLQVPAAVVCVYLNRGKSWVYDTIAKSTDIKASPKVPIRIRGEFVDIDGNQMRAGSYWVQYIREGELWLVPMRRGASGSFVKITELVRKCEPISEIKYE